MLWLCERWRGIDSINKIRNSGRNPISISDNKDNDCTINDSSNNHTSNNNYSNIMGNNI